MVALPQQVRATTQYLTRNLHATYAHQIPFRTLLSTYIARSKVAVMGGVTVRDVDVSLL